MKSEMGIDLMDTNDDANAYYADNARVYEYTKRLKKIIDKYDNLRVNPIIIASWDQGCKKNFNLSIVILFTNNKKQYNN